MNLNFLPYSMYADGFVSDDDANLLEKYIDEDISNIEFKTIDSGYHHIYSTSPNYNLTYDANINWEKYKDILTPYISDFILKLTDNIKNLELDFYLNICKKGNFLSPHFDGDTLKTSFQMIYCPKKYENANPFTTYFASEKYYRTFSKYEKLPLTDDLAVNLYHERGKFFIAPGNLLHWVAQVNDDTDRITLMTTISPEFKS